jgi:hypothetical protein
MKLLLNPYIANVFHPINQLEDIGKDINHASAAIW